MIHIDSQGIHALEEDSLPEGDVVVDSYDYVMPSSEDVYRDIARDNGISHAKAENGKRRTYISKKFDLYFGGFEEYCLRLAKMEKPVIPVGRDEFRRPYVKRQGLGRFYHMMLHYLYEYDANFKYSEYIEAAYELARDFRFLEDGRVSDNARFAWRHETYDGIDLCNQYFDQLAKIFRNAKFARKLEQRVKQGERIKTSLNELIDLMLNQHSRVCVIRIDLEYTRDDPTKYVHPLNSADYPNDYLIEKVKRDFKRFLNGLRQLKIADHLVGYAWRLQFGAQRGYHYHFIAFFNGNKVGSHWYYADQIGQYWSKVAGQHGFFFNCHNDHLPYKRDGIGMVRRKDKDKIKALRKAAAYLGHQDQLLQVRTGKCCRTFGCTNLPAQETTDDYLSLPDDDGVFSADPKSGELPFGAVGTSAGASFTPAPFDLRRRYSSTFMRGMAVSSQNPVIQNARRYIRTHVDS